jgi:hypothetical protein
VTAEWGKRQYMGNVGDLKRRSLSCHRDQEINEHFLSPERVVLDDQFLFMKYGI